MENKQNNGILDFINKLQAAANKNADKNLPAAANDNNAKSGVNSGTNLKSNENERNFSGAQNTQNGQYHTPAEEKDDKSFMRSYNPFGTAAFERPQVVAPRAKKPLKEKIDLASSKNVAGKSKPEVKNDMVQLINKHNRLSAKLHGQNSR